MTTTGEQLVALSGLGANTALFHLVSITTGSGPSAAQIAEAVVTALNLTAIPVNTVKIKGQDIQGTGSEADPWGP